MWRSSTGPLVDDKPVKVTVELPAALYADLASYATPCGRYSQPRPPRKADRTDAGSVHVHRSRVRKGEAAGSGWRQRIAGADEIEEAAQNGAVVVGRNSRNSRSARGRAPHAPRGKLRRKPANLAPIPDDRHMLPNATRLNTVSR